MMRGHDEGKNPNSLAVSDEVFSERMRYREIEEFIKEFQSDRQFTDEREVYPEWFLQAKEYRREQNFQRRRTQAQALDEAFYKKLEKAGGVGFCATARGELAMTYMFAQGWRTADSNNDLLKQIIKSANKLEGLVKSGLIDGRLMESPFDCGVVTILDDFIAMKKESLRHSRRAGRPAKRIGTLGLTLLEIYDASGGTVRFNKKDREKYNGPCADFLREFWKIMPADLRPPSPETFVDYAKKALISQRKGQGA